MHFVTAVVLPLALALSAPVTQNSQATTPARWVTTPLGQTLLRSFPTAPLPHASRARGYTNNGIFFDASHYNDSTIGVFIPSGFHPSTESVDFLVHLHGWSNHVARVLDRYRLREQVEASGVNAILVVPQGPRDAQDSGDGKLEHDPGAFAAMMRDVANFLVASGKTRTANVGHIVLSAHSGGYKGASFILQIGGLSDHITDVLLFDAAYNDFGGFIDWADADQDRRLASVFTDDTAGGNVELIAGLQQHKRPFTVVRGADFTPAVLANRHTLFLYTPDLPHDETMQGRSYYELFLRTSAVSKRKQ